MEHGVPRVSEATFTKTQRQTLAGFGDGPREREATNATILMLERKGFLRRLAGPRPSRIASHAVILWEITSEGQARLCSPE